MSTSAMSTFLGDPTSPIYNLTYTSSNTSDVPEWIKRQQQTIATPTIVTNGNTDTITNWYYPQDNNIYIGDPPSGWMVPNSWPSPTAPTPSPSPLIPDTIERRIQEQVQRILEQERERERREREGDESVGARVSGSEDAIARAPGSRWNKMGVKKKTPEEDGN